MLFLCVCQNQQQYSAQLMTVSASRKEMPNHPSYHGILDSKEAEQRLAVAGESGCNSYLTRYSETYRSYVVSVSAWYNGSRLPPAHFQLNIDTDAGYFSIEGSQKHFHTLNELLSYYEMNPISPNVRSIGSVCPVPGDYQHASFQMSGKLKRRSHTSQTNSEMSMDEKSTIWFLWQFKYSHQRDGKTAPAVQRRDKTRTRKTQKTNEWINKAEVFNQPTSQ